MICHNKSEPPAPNPNVLLLFPGPTYRLNETFEQRLTLLSRHFCGHVVTCKPGKEEVTYSKFSVHAIEQGNSKILFLLRYFAKVFSIFRRCRKSNRIRLVVSYDPMTTGIIGVITARLFHAKVVCEVNGDYGHIANYMEIRSDFRRRLRMKLNIAVARFVLRRADGIKLLYPDQLRSLTAARSATVVSSFPEYTVVGKFKNLGDRPEILLAGFPFYVKGVDVLIAAFKKISPQHPEWSLTILGYYPDKTLLRSAIGDCEKVQVLDPVHHSEMPAYLGRCGIFALPSRTEGMGRVLLEAMAAGKPRIGTRVGGIPTTIEDGVDGLLIPPDDVDALAESLDTLISSPELRQKFAQAGIERVRQEFSTESYINHVRDLYGAVLGGQ